MKQHSRRKGLTEKSAGRFTVLLEGAMGQLDLVKSV